MLRTSQTSLAREVKNKYFLVSRSHHSLLVVKKHHYPFIDNIMETLNKNTRRPWLWIITMVPQTQTNTSQFTWRSQLVFYQRCHHVQGLFLTLKEATLEWWTELPPTPLIALIVWPNLSLCSLQPTIGMTSSPSPSWMSDKRMMSHYKPLLTRTLRQWLVYDSPNQHVGDEDEGNEMYVPRGGCTI